MRSLLVLTLLTMAAPAWAQSACNAGVVFADRNGNTQRDRGEQGLAGIKVSDGTQIVVTDREGRYSLPVVDGRTVFVIKPAGYRVPLRADGMPDFWRHLRIQPGPALKYGGIPVQAAACRDFALQSQPSQKSGDLDVLVLTDPQTKSLVDVGYYQRDVIASIKAMHAPTDLGISLGDIAHDDLSLYAALNRVTSTLGVPWLHVAGNHDLDFDAPRDEDSLLTFRNTYGPDTFAWEEAQAVFIGLDDVIYRPRPEGGYIGGLREDQFAFLTSYLSTVPKHKRVVIGVHIPFFDAAPGKETFRHADRERLFSMLKDFPDVLLLSGHSHAQRHVFHDAASGWHGARPLHEYNVGAACGAFWSGVKDAQGIPDTTMADGTPNGFATLQIAWDRSYRLTWHPARDIDAQIALHAPKVLRRGSWPGTGVYANVFMGHDDTRVEFRIDEGEWKPMQRVVQPDPRVVEENLRDDAVAVLRGYDRLPEAAPSMHLWRGTLPTQLEAGEHHVRVRAFGVVPGHVAEQEATSYRLVEGTP
ncbi:calcineurin-like phosphoesterase C-terminal domain-containing protein [Lysobacter tyrosinilyticus]